MTHTVCQTHTDWKHWYFYPTLRNIIQFDEASCGFATLIGIYQTFKQRSTNLELIEKTNGMMEIEYTYANFDETESAFDPDCDKSSMRGLYIQTKRDAAARDRKANTVIKFTIRNRDSRKFKTGNNFVEK